MARRSAVSYEESTWASSHKQSLCTTVPSPPVWKSKVYGTFAPSTHADPSQVGRVIAEK